MVQNVRYWNGQPSHVTLPFEYGIPILSAIQEFGIQIVTVSTKSCWELCVLVGNVFCVFVCLQSNEKEDDGDQCLESEEVFVSHKEQI